MNKNLTVIVMAGGIGKRMESSIPKVLHKINGIPMIIKILKQVEKLSPDRIILIVGKFKHQIENIVNKYNIQNIIYTIQKKPLGTGDAVKQTIHLLKKNSYNLILSGDVPLIKYNTLQNIIENNKYPLQITCIEINRPEGYGRIILTNDQFERIVEHKDCTEKQRKIKLVNCSIYVAKTEILQKLLPLIQNNNRQKEYYLTDIVHLAKLNNISVGHFELDKIKYKEILNANTKKQLTEIKNIDSFQYFYH